ncbi:hypothetical protein FY526_27155, partial [Clostridioides difficile]
MEQRKVLVSLLASVLVLSSTAGITAAANTDNNTNKTTTNSSNTTSSKSATENKVVHTLGNLSPVKVTARSSVRLTDVNILSQDDGNI